MAISPWRVGTRQVSAQDVTELRAVLGLPDSVDWTVIQGKPSTFPPSAHTHPIDQIENLAEALASRTTKRIQTYAGTTNASGEYTVTFPTAFSAVPWVIPEPPNSANYFWMRISVSTTGATYRLVQRAAVTVLTVEVLLAAVVPVSGAACRLVVVGD